MPTVNPCSIQGPKPQFIDTNGLPLVGGKLFFYRAGSSTKQNTYTDSTGNSANQNPIILNAYGEPTDEIWFQAGLSYKAILAPSTDTDPPTSPIWTIDNLRGINDTSVTIDQWIASGLTPTFVSATQFTLAGDQTSTFTVGRRIKATVTAGTVYGTITASAFAALTTVTVALDSGALDSGLSAVSYGLISSLNSSLPLIAGERVAITYPGGAPTISAKSFPVRQSIISGPVDASGFSAFGGATGTTTVTAAGTLIASVANGFNANGGVDRLGSITNPSWTGLSTNGTMYLFLDVAADGTCTTGSGTLVPVYQWGGAYSTTLNQFTFNIQEMIGKVGTGAVANQTYRIYVGEVTVAGAVVTAITWYQLMGRYDSGFTATLPTASSQTARNHNLGIYPENWDVIIECTTTDVGFAVGDRLKASGGLASFNGATSAPFGFSATRNTMQVTTVGGGSAFLTTSKTGFTLAGLTAASWKYKMTARRGW